MSTKKLWIIFSAVMILSFGVLGYYGIEIYHKAPPLPSQVVSSDGSLIFSAEDVTDGQNVWQSIGGHELGTVWGHGSYIAPDWTADWIHREGKFIVDKWANAEHQMSFDKLNAEKAAGLQARLQELIRKNTYNTSTGAIVVDPVIAEAIRNNCVYYTSLFMNDPKLEKTRNAYAMRLNTVNDSVRMNKLNAFFFWASWACTTTRPGESITYTNNWPGDDLVGNKPAGSQRFGE